MSGEAQLGSVLVVEDDVPTRDLFVRWLEAGHFQVEEAGSAEDALVMLGRGAYDVVCLDLQLPGMGGLDALALVRQLHPGVPVIIFTADREVDTVVVAMQRGAHGYISKPVTRDRFMGAVSRAADARRAALEQAAAERERTGARYGGMLGRHKLMREMFVRLDRLGPSDAAVLIRGESGAGKELVARALCQKNTRYGSKFVSLNCAALPDSLIESELFGHERGAFTGALSQRKGVFETAHGGTIFLDEIGELSPHAQAKLLRVLQERILHRVGGNTDVRVDFRLITATHRDLHADVAAGRFRADLFFRIAVVEVHVPPLRDRGEDILLLANATIAELGGPNPPRLSEEAEKVLLAYHWPGNVRELRNAMQHACVETMGPVIEPAALPLAVRGESRISPTPPVPAERVAAKAPAAGASEENGATAPLASIEQKTILETLERVEGNVAEAARLLGIGRATLYRKLKRYGKKG